MVRLPKRIPQAAQESQHPSAIPRLATVVLDHEDINLEAQHMDVDEEWQKVENRLPQGIARHHSKAEKVSVGRSKDYSIVPPFVDGSNPISDVSETNRRLLNHIITNITNTFLHAARLDHSSTTNKNQDNAPTTPLTAALHAFNSDVLFAGIPHADVPSIMEPQTRNLIELLTTTQQAASEAGELRQRVSSLEVQNEGLIRTREMEVERLRDIVKDLVDKVALKRKEIRIWEGMAMDREGEVQRLRRRLDLLERGGEAEL